MASDFDEYIRQGDPGKRGKAYAWSTAIGLQAVDGLTTSDYLKDTARRNIDSVIKDCLTTLSSPILQSSFRISGRFILFARAIHVLRPYSLSST